MPHLQFHITFKSKQDYSYLLLIASDEDFLLISLFFLIDDKYQLISKLIIFYFKILK